MNTRGKFKAYNPIDGTLTFSTEKIPQEALQEIVAADVLDITAKKHHPKRSLDANAYLWVLCTKIAEVVRTSKDEIYEEMLQKYGYLSDVTITVKTEVDMSRITGHWKFYKQSGDGKFKAYIMIRGTSEYNRAEMAKFTDMVVEEAKEIGVETLPPDELQRLKDKWGVE